MTKPSRVLRYKNGLGEPVRPGERVPLKLSKRQRELILKRTFTDDELTAPLHVAHVSNKASVCSFTLDDLEELMGYVAAEAHHTKDKNLQKELDRLFEQMEEVLNSYADEDDRSTV